MAIKTLWWQRCFNAVDNVNAKIGPAIIGYDATEQVAIDNLMLKLDGTDNKANLGPMQF